MVADRFWPLILFATVVFLLVVVHRLDLRRSSAWPRRRVFMNEKPGQLEKAISDSLISRFLPDFDLDRSGHGHQVPETEIRTR